MDAHDQEAGPRHGAPCVAGVEKSVGVDFNVDTTIGIVTFIARHIPPRGARAAGRRRHLRQGVLVGNLFGILAATAAEGESVEIATVGVCELPKLASAVIAALPGTIPPNRSCCRHRHGADRGHNAGGWQWHRHGARSARRRGNGSGVIRYVAAIRGL